MIVVYCCHVLLPCASRDASKPCDAAKLIAMAACVLHGGCVVEDGARNLVLIESLVADRSGASA